MLMVYIPQLNMFLITPDVREMFAAVVKYGLHQSTVSEVM